MNLGFLFAAYAVVWAGIFVYVLSLTRRTQSLQREVQELRELLGQRGPTP